MNAYCHGCAMRFIGKCDAYDLTYKKKIIKPFCCPEYRQVTVADVVKDGKRYRIIDNFTHQFIEELPSEEAREKYGKCIWRSGYSHYSCIDMWVDFKCRNKNAWIRK